MAGAVVCWTGMPRAGLAGGRRAAFLAPVWGVGVVRGAGRSGSVACGVAQRALLCVFMFVLMSFLYFRSYFRCIFSFFVFVCLCAAVYGVIKNNNNYYYYYYSFITPYTAAHKYKKS